MATINITCPAHPEHNQTRTTEGQAIQTECAACIPACDEGLLRQWQDNPTIYDLVPEGYEEVFPGLFLPPMDRQQQIASARYHYGAGILECPICHRYVRPEEGTTCPDCGAKAVSLEEVS